VARILPSGGFLARLSQGSRRGVTGVAGELAAVWVSAFWRNGSSVFPLPRDQKIALATTRHRLDGYSIALEGMAPPGPNCTVLIITLPKTSDRLDGSDLAVYTTNMATPAANIATVVIATTVHPKRELG
jgi:hypothetical protein